MKIEITRTQVKDILPLRDLYRREMNCQIVHDSFAQRGFSDAYLIQMAGDIAGYALVANRYDADTVDEFYLLEPYRPFALAFFRELLKTSQATKIRAQTNDHMMLLMLYDCATNITSDTILFEDAFTTHLPCPAGTLRKISETEKERVFEHKHEPVGEWVIEPGQNHFGLPKERGSLEHFFQEGHVEGGLVALVFDAVLTGMPL
jgi:hypothetical protein